MKKNEINTIFSKTFIVLNTLYQKDGIRMTELHKRSGVAYSHLYTIRKIMLNEGWIEIITDEKRKLIHLLPKGLRICQSITTLFNMVGISDNDLNSLKEEDDKNEDKHREANRTI